LHGVVAIALSHYRKRELPSDWPRVTRWAAEVIRELLQLPIEPGLFWNVNFPHLRADEADPPVVYCPLDTSPLPLEFHIDEDTFAYNGNYHLRRREPGGDVDVCFGGGIAVSPLRLA
jgi:5'-nucleotidase